MTTQLPVQKTTIHNGEIAFIYEQPFPGKPTLVFLHDSLGCIEVWRDFPKRLATLAGLNVLIYDRHGYGQSGALLSKNRTNDYLEDETEILLELLEKCPIDQPILFGHSDGGSIALIAAAKYPQKIKAVITEGAHIFVESETVKGIREAIDLYRTTDLKTKLEKYHGEKTDDLFRAWTQTWTSEVFQSWNIEHFLPQIQCPLLVIQGDADEYGTLAQVNGIVDQVSGITEKAILPEIKHTPHKEDPDSVIQLTTRFLNQMKERHEQSDCMKSI